MIKVETRGKYPGVKIHLDAEEAQQLIGIAESAQDHVEAYKGATIEFVLARKMGNKIKDLLAAEPGLLQERSPESIAAILAKEVEKASMQLNQLKAGSSWQKVDPVKLQDALNKHVPHK